jgi:hypothetical protein
MEEPFMRHECRTTIFYFHGSKQLAIDLQPLDRFSNCSYFKPLKPIYVRAAVRAEHGDWKTQLARKDEFMGLKPGEVGQLAAVWTNFEGQQLRVVRLDGKECDLQARDLEVIDEATYRFAEILHTTKFHYETDHTDIPHFGYDHEIAVGHTMQVMKQKGETIRIRVLAVEHVMGLVGEIMRPLYIRLSVEWVE